MSTLRWQAAIVRALKMRRRMHHGDLIQSVSQQLANRFVPDTADVKRNICRLIDKDYIARDPDEKDIYIYCP